MKKLSFYIVDVFAERKFTGNQLAVVIAEDELSEAEMQSIAREFNFSETTFIMSDKESVRIFTPREEVPFAGHPVLGTAYIIQREIIQNPVKELSLSLKAGKIPVRFSSEEETKVLWMRQKEPEFGRTFEASEVSQVLGLKAEEIDSNFPIQEVSTGLPFIIVPLRSLESLKRCVVNRDEYFRLIENTEAKAVLVFCPETYSNENHLSARMFAEYYGVAEDPATGSAAGCLAGYLVKHRYFKSREINLRMEQGYEIGRPSLLYLKARERDGEIEVRVGGRVEMIARGEIFI